MTRVVAAVDCGTNSIRLLVAEVRPDGTLRDLARENTIIRLGEGVDATGRFTDGAIERCRVALAGYVEQAAGLGATAIRMVATSATRDAANRDDFFAMTREVLGAQFPGAVAEVITGDTEAQLTFAGAVAALDPADGPFVVTDLGGGSTEVVVGTVSTAGEVDIHGGVSLDIGCVRLTERVLHSDPPTADELAGARSVINEALALTAGLPLASARTWVGVAGTFTTLAALALELPDYDADAIDGSVIDAPRLREVCDSLLASSVAERRALGPMHPGRADVIGGGSLVAGALAELFAGTAGIDRLTVSEHDILDGIAMSVV